MERPRDEVERRYADSAPSWLIPRMAAVQNLRQLWHESAQKRADDHRLQMRALGMEDIVGKGEVEMPGDINITGDTYNITQLPPTAQQPTPPAPNPQPTPQPAPTPATNTTSTTTVIDRARGRFRNWALAALLGAGLPLLGAGALAAYHWYFDKPENVTNITQEGAGQELDTSYAIHTFPGPPPSQ